MECANCQRLSHDLTTVTIALKNIKKWVKEKLESEIPRCLDYPTIDQVKKIRLKNHKLIAECLKKRVVVRLEKLSLPTSTSINTTQSQESASSTDDFDIVSNGQNIESRSESESSISIRRDILIQNNSDGDSLPLLSIPSDPNRISFERKGPILSSIRTYSKKNVSNQLNSYENRDLKKDIFIENVITSTTTTESSKIKPNSSHLIKDNCIKPPPKIKKPNLKPKPKRKNTSHLKKQDSLCPECGKVFSCVKYLNVHIRGVHKYKADKYKPKDQECPHCYKKFTKRQLKKHIQFIHPTDPKSLQRICPFCAITFKNEGVLKKHLATVHNEDRTKFKCSFTGCNREFYWEYELKTHAKTHSEDINVARPFKCTIEECDKHFSNIYNLNSHIEKCHKDKDLRDQEQIFICQRVIDGVGEKCSERFLNHSGLKLHNYSVHNYQYEFKCTFDGCFQSYKRENDLISHLKFHGKINIVNKKVVFKECPICLKQINVSRYSGNFKNHIQFVHEDKRPYSCSFDNCEKSFKSKENFGYHVKRHHPDHFKPEDYPPSASKDYTCIECNRKFHAFPALRQHKTTHLKVGTFSCNFCDLKFKRKPFVSYHVQAVHSGLRPFACNYENCDKTFALKYYLKSHISAVHLGKPRTRPLKLMK